MLPSIKCICDGSGSAARNLGTESEYSARCLACDPMPVCEMTNEQVLACRKWPARFTVEQCRQQLLHEERGCPPPWPGAVWDPKLGVFVGKR